MIRTAFAFWMLGCAAAQAIALTPPVDCGAGGCLVQNYVDLDPGPGVKDHRCGGASYEGHIGVDFRAPSAEAFDDGVPVRAVADGVVTLAIDGEPDALLSEDAPGALARCGNSLILDLGDGWAARYCHLRNGSVRLRPGDRVTAGQAIGVMGASGATTFPHVHFDLHRNGALIDPFTGLSGADCKAQGASLWAGGLPLSPPRLVAFGLGGSEPGFEAARSRRAPTPLPARRDDDLHVWAVGWNLGDGDEIRIQAMAPDGRIIADEPWRLGNRAPEFMAALKMTPADVDAALWPTGVYVIRALLLHAGAQIDARTLTATMR